MTTDNSQQETPVQLTDERIHEIRLKYEPLFKRQPNYTGLAEGYFADSDGNWTETVGIIVSVSERVDQNTLPTADRIPACLEGVPVQIEEGYSYMDYLPPATTPSEPQDGGTND